MLIALCGFIIQNSRNLRLNDMKDNCAGIEICIKIGSAVESWKKETNEQYHIPTAKKTTTLSLT